VERKPKDENNKITTVVVDGGSFIYHTKQKNKNYLLL